MNTRKLLAAVLFLAVAAGALVYTNSQKHVNSNENNLAVPTAGVHDVTTGPITFEGMQDKRSKMGLVAHAFGTIDGVTYTNSIEAFKESYEKGFRYFEVDLVLLNDGNILTAHDAHEADYGLDKPFTRATREELAGAKVNGKYTPLFGDQFIKLVRDYPDVYIMLDTKMEHTKIIASLADAAGRDPGVMNRLIPHVSDQKNLDEVRAVYPFKYTMLALFRLLSERPYSEEEIISYVQRNNITTVMVNIRENDISMAKIDNGTTPGTFSFKHLHERLNSVHIPHYVHSTAEEERIKQFRGMGVGVYSNGVIPNENK